jgi:transposase
MRRVIGIDIHRTFGEMVFWEDGRLRRAGRIDMTRTALEGFGKSLLVKEATANSMGVSRVLAPFVARVIIANPLQVKAIAQAHVKTDKIDAGTLASLHAAGYLPQIWTPDAATERKRRLATRRYQVVRHRTRLKNEVQQQKGSRRGPAYAYNIKALRDREMLVAAQAERSYEPFVAQWKPRRPKIGPQLGKT